MSIIIGLDFGSHTASIALWYEEKNVIEVIADELGSRTIPTVVAYRNDEVIVGQAALSQQHKNSANTFADVRALILDESVTNVYVPVLEREVPVQEIVSHFFRNIHNQIKQQVGKPIRECVLSISSITLEESVRARLIECAQVGGIRIKAIVNDSAATLMAFGLDVVAPAAASAAAASAAGGSAAVSEAVAPFQRVLVVDIGWTAAVATVYGVSSGIFFTLGSRTVNQCSGSVLVKNMAEHCAKDFQRRAKVSCADSSKAMMRIRVQCEEAMKHLSTGQEATIDIDSLYEGIDYCSKITRARFEDLSSIPLVQLRVAITELLQSVSGGADQPAAVEVDSVLLAGGLAAMPKLASVVKGLFPSAVFPRARFEQSESVCIGAANQAKFLIETGLADAAPTATPAVATLQRPLALRSQGVAVPVLPRGSVLPAVHEVTADLAEGLTGKAAVELVSGEVVVAVLVWDVQADHAQVSIAVSVDVSGVASVSVTSAANKEVVLASVEVPALSS